MARDREKANAATKRWRVSHPEAWRAQKGRNKKKHPERGAAARRRAYARDPDKFIELSKIRRKEHPELKAMSDKRYRLRYPEKRVASLTAKYAISTGKVSRPIACSMCGVEGVMIEGHHYDYTKPLDLTWVCGKCHRAIHQKNPYRKRRLT